MAGYSTNPLWKKLGIKEGFHCFLFNAPMNYFDLLEYIPHETSWDEMIQDITYDFIHVFVTEQETLDGNWQNWKKSLSKEGIMWISWPKGTSKIKTNLNGNLVREIGLDGGLVDVKVCAVDENWSGLKFMYRKKDR